MAKILAKKNSLKFTDEHDPKLKRPREQAKVPSSNAGFERSAANSGSTFLAKHKVSSTSHTSNANESTLPLTNQWDSIVRESKVEKEFRSNSDTGRNIALIEEELRAINSKNAKHKTEINKIFPNTHREGSDTNAVKDSAHISEKLLAYLKLQSQNSPQQPTFTAYCSPILKRKVSFGEMAGLKAYQAKSQVPAATKSNRNTKQNKPLHSYQANSTKNSARGKNLKNTQENIGNFSARNIETGSQADHASISQLFFRKHSEQCDHLKNSYDAQLLSKTGELTSLSIRNTIKSTKKGLSNPAELQEFAQSTKNSISKKISDIDYKTRSLDVQEFRSITKESENCGKDGTMNQLLALMGRIDSVFLRYEREEIRLRQKNEHLLQLLDKKLAEKSLQKIAKK